ncbi:MAG: S1 RNA-binding domain-containing protein, partial [Spiribacter salinus]
QCQPNPWDEFAAQYNKGDRVTGAIKSITDFGIFVGLEGGIDGLVHLSDLSWSDAGEESIHEFQKGEEVEAVVLSVDPERERISLGVKQLAQDPVSQWVANHPKGTIVTGTATEVDAKGVVVDLGDEVLGYLRASDLDRERVEDARTVVKEGDSVEAKFMAVDRRNRMISLSVRAKDQQDEREVVQDYGNTGAAGTTTLGDLLKEQMSDRDADE